MDRQNIIKLLTEGHSSFVQYINGLTNDEFLFTYLQKWTAGQQLKHINLAIRPVTLALSLPKFFLRFIFGKANRPGRTYEDLVKKYLNKLENGGKAAGRFIPKFVTLNQKETITKALTKNTKLLCSKIETFTERELDTLILPHPLLGKLTLREMIYFTIYHVSRHHQITKRNLKVLFRK